MTDTLDVPFNTDDHTTPEVLRHAAQQLDERPDQELLLKLYSSKTSITAIPDPDRSSKNVLVHIADRFWLSLDLGLAAQLGNEILMSVGAIAFEHETAPDTTSEEPKS